MNGYTSVWDALEDSPGEAENLRIRSALMRALAAHIKNRGMTQTEAAKVLHVTQPRVSDLARGRIDLFSIDALVNMAAAVGLRVEVGIHASAGAIAADTTQPTLMPDVASVALSQSLVEVTPEQSGVLDLSALQTQVEQVPHATAAMKGAGIKDAARTPTHQVKPGQPTQGGGRRPAQGAG